MIRDFSKVEGLGNDFILVDRRRADAAGLAAAIAWSRAHAAALCDRRTGIGADGILWVGPPRDGADASMTVVNFDGSRPEMCGNGLRCVAAHVAGFAAGFEAGDPITRLTIATDAGLRRCEIIGRSGEQIEVRIAMGAARRLGLGEPAAAPGRRFHGVSMGNPHAVCFVDAGEDPEALARGLGPGVEVDPIYLPDKTNVEFARVEADGGVRLWVWERGVGITGACGTGACATAAAAVDAERLPAETDLPIRLPGGALTIRVPADPKGDVIMTGPARQVFHGRLER